MIFWSSILIIFIISFVLALRVASHELSVPHEVKRIKINKKNGFSGVILFLKKKIIHYTTLSSS
jgi:hypothetical protein